MLVPSDSHRLLNTLHLDRVMVNILENVNLDKNQGQELCDEIAEMLLNTLESQKVDDKIDAAINVFLTKQKINADPSALAQKLSWSVKVRMEA